METVTVNRHGQVTLPVRERKKFGIKPGMTLKVEPKKNGILLKKAAVLDGEVIDKFRRLADEKGITDKDLIRMAREVGRQVYEEEYG